MIELPLKPRHLHPQAKKIKASTSNSGVTGGKKNKMAKGAGLQVMAQAKKDAQQETRDNRRILVLLPNGKRKFVKISELK